MNSRLKELVLVTIVASAIGLLDGELFYLSLLKGSEGLSLKGFRQISVLGPTSLSIFGYIGGLANLLSEKIYTRFNEQGVFVVYFICLALGSLFYLKVLERFSKDLAFSFVVALWAIIGIVSSVRDLSIALAFLLCGLELLLLTDHRRAIRLLFLPLCLVHLGVDSSFFLPLVFFLLAQNTKRSVALSLLLLANTAWITCQGGLISAYSVSSSLLTFFFGVVLALLNRSLALFFVSLLYPFLFFSWEELSNQRFPASSYFVPLLIAVIWAKSELSAKSRFVESLFKLKQAFSNFLTIKNRLALSWLCLAFIFFQTATKFIHPLNDAYLPNEAMDVFAEAKPDSPPLHPIRIGGYVGYRLAPLINSYAPLNYLDLSAKSAFPEPAKAGSNSLNYKQYTAIWRGENPLSFSELGSTNILCQGIDPICKQLKVDANWEILSRSSFGDRILQKLNNLPTKQKELVWQRLEAESWYLLTKK